MENEQNKIDEKTQGVGFYKPSLRIGKRCIDVESVCIVGKVFLKEK